MLKENERFDQLIKENFSIIQNDDVFTRFDGCFVVRAFYKT